MKTNLSTKKIALAGVFTALAVVGSFISFPVAGSKCAPVQHMVNILAAVTLGPFWGIGIAFIASLLRNLLALGSLMAFPGSMVGALCCGLVYHFSRKLSLTCAAEALGTGILGGIAAYPVAVYLMGLSRAGIFVYIVPFLISTVAGRILAFLLITVLEKGGVMIGGEESGGIGLPDHVKERDGLLMALLLTECMAQSGKDLGAIIDEMLADIGRLEFARRGLSITDEQMARFRAETVPAYTADEIAGKRVLDVDRRDGVKLLLEGDAWVMMRPSGTEPLVRIYAEAATTDEVNELLDAAEAVVTSL